VRGRGERARQVFRRVVRSRNPRHVEGIVDNAEDCTPEEVTDMFGLPVEVVRRILRFAGLA
jgi:hypothetical protein